MAFHGGSLDGTVSPPPSKSHTHRAFFLASMAGGRSRITNALLSADTKATLAACRAMGAKVTEEGGAEVITGGDLHTPGHVDAENSGTTMRIFSGICSMSPATSPSGRGPWGRSWRHSRPTAPRAPPRTVCRR